MHTHPPQIIRIYTHMHIHTHKPHACAHMHPWKCMQTGTFSHKSSAHSHFRQSYTHSYMLMPTYTHAHMCMFTPHMSTPTHTHSHTPQITHVHVFIQSHTHAHTETHSCTCPHRCLLINIYGCTHTITNTQAVLCTQAYTHASPWAPVQQ